jgi:hypothetical protein
VWARRIDFLIALAVEFQIEKGKRMNEGKTDHSPTTIGTYGLAIQKALEANGYAAADIFAAAGIDHVPSNSPLERLTTAQVADLFRECVKLTGNPAIGLTVARFMHPSTLHALGYSLLASSSLRDCCERMVNYFRLASEQAEIRITEVDDRFCLSTHLLTDQLAFETLDAWNAFVVRLFRLIHLPDFAPIGQSGKAVPPWLRRSIPKKLSCCRHFRCPLL